MTDRRTGWTGLAWIVAGGVGTSVGGVVGLIAGWIVMLILFVVSAGFGRVAQGTSLDVLNTAVQIVGVLVVAILMGVLLGGAQQRALRAAIPQATGWVSATAAAGALAGIIVVALVGLVSITANVVTLLPTVVGEVGAIVGGVIGSMVGIAQWLILRRHIRRAGWWIPANALAGAAGCAFSFVLIWEQQWGPRGWGSTLGFIWIAFQASIEIALVGGFVMGIIGGAITGIVLDVLLSHEADLPVRQPPWWNILLRLAILSLFIGWAVGRWVAH